MKIKLNLEKTKVMIVNFSREKEFNITLKVNDQEIETVNKVKLLGTILTSDLKWNETVQYIIRRANSRMIILRKISQFTKKLDDLKQIYISFIRSIIEQSCQVWNFSLTNENSEDLERIQKNALKIILGNNYKNYETALRIMNLEDLRTRRDILCKKFAENCTRYENTKQMFSKKYLL